MTSAVRVSKKGAISAAHLTIVKRSDVASVTSLLGARPVLGQDGLRVVEDVRATDERRTVYKLVLKYEKDLRQILASSIESGEECVSRTATAQMKKKRRREASANAYAVRRKKAENK